MRVLLCMKSPSTKAPKIRQQLYGRNGYFSLHVKEGSPNNIPETYTRDVCFLGQIKCAKLIVIHITDWLWISLFRQTTRLHLTIAIKYLFSPKKERQGRRQLAGPSDNDVLQTLHQVVVVHLARYHPGLHLKIHQTKCVRNPHFFPVFNTVYLYC